MKLGAENFNTVNRSLSLGLYLEITVVLLLGHFFAILIFLPYRKALEPSTDTPVASTAPYDMLVTDTMTGHNSPADKYIVLYTFHIIFFFCFAFFWTEHRTLLQVFSLTLAWPLSIPYKKLTWPFLIEIYLFSLS